MEKRGPLCDCAAPVPAPAAEAQIGENVMATTKENIRKMIIGLAGLLLLVLSGINKPKTLSRPRARTHIAAVVELSIPPLSPNTTPVFFAIETCF